MSDQLNWNRDKFLAWESANREKLRINKVYIDMAGDLVAGVLLSQIVYWHTPDKDGKSKLRVKKDGVYWLVKSDSEWLEECRIGAKQARRAIADLIALGLIEKRIMRFNNAPTAHLRIVWNRFFELLESHLPVSVEEGEALDDLPVLGKSDLPQKVKSELPQKGKSYNRILQTDTTTTYAPDGANANSNGDNPSPLDHVGKGVKKTRDALFEAVLKGGWSTIYQPGLKLPAATRVTVGKVVTALLEMESPPTPDEVTAYYVWARERGGAGYIAVQSPGKLPLKILEFRQQRHNPSLSAILSQL